MESRVFGREESDGYVMDYSVRGRMTLVGDLTLGICVVLYREFLVYSVCRYDKVWSRWFFI